MRPASSGSWRFFCMPATISAAGAPGKFIKSFSRASNCPKKAYGLNQLRYDLRKLKGHDLLERDGSRYAYRLTSKGFQVALLFLFFHKRLCGPLANSRFHHQPDADHRPKSKLEAAYYKADRATKTLSISSRLPDTAACRSSTNYAYDF